LNERCWNMVRRPRCIRLQAMPVAGAWRGGVPKHPSAGNCIRSECDSGKNEKTPAMRVAGAKSSIGH
jgi:hypothetical protein